VIRTVPTHNCATCPSRHTTDWRVLSESELSQVDRAKRTRAYEAGEALYHQGDACTGLYCIQSGMIGMRRTDEHGDSFFVRMLSGGTTVGYRSFLSKEDYRDTAEVLAPSIVCFIDAATASRLLNENPKLGERFLQHCIEDMDATEDDYARSLTKSLKSRFLHVMMVFYERLGTKGDDGRETFRLPIQRNELAALIGAQPESISRLIRNLENDGLLAFNKRQVQIADKDAVLREMGAEH